MLICALATRNDSIHRTLLRNDTSTIDPNTQIDSFEELCITIILVLTLLVSSEIFAQFTNLVVVFLANTPFS